MADEQSGSVQQTILIIDDDFALREAIVDLLDILGLPSLTASSGVEGIKQYNAHWRDIAFVWLDYTLNDTTATQLIPLLKEINPAVVTVLVTGYNHVQDKLGDVEPSLIAVKPLELQDVKDIIERFVEKARS